jgi:hypothetical protein
MEPETAKPQISLADFEQSSEFLILTERQRNFVLKYFEHRDMDAAVAYAYPTQKQLGRRGQRNQLMVSPQVQAAINLWYGTSARDAMIASVQRDIRRTKSARLRYDLKVLLCKIQGLIQ